MRGQPEDDFQQLLQQFFHQPAAPEDKLLHAGFLRTGDRCPWCGMGLLDYDGTLTLTCNRCGMSSNGGGACT